MKLILTTLITSTMVWGCSAEDLQRDAKSLKALGFTQEETTGEKSRFEAMLEQGRSAHYETSTSYGLTGTSQNLMHFNTDEQPDVNEQNLVANSKQILATELLLDEQIIKSLVPAQNHKVQLNKNLISINYARLHNGIRVKDAFIEVVYTKVGPGTYRLREVLNQSFGTIDTPTSAQSPDFSVVADVTGRSDFSLLSTKSIVFPKALEDGTTDFLMATQFDVQGEKPEDGFILTISNTNSELLEVHPKNHSYTQLQAEVLDRSHIFGDSIEWDIPMTSVIVDGNTAQTDLDGYIDLDDTDSITLELTSPRLRNREGSASGPGYRITADVEQDSSGKMLVRTEGADQRALNSYLAIHRVIRYALRYVATDEVRYFRNQINMVFDRNDTCNAYYSSAGDNIRLFENGNGCASMALVNDVIYHEWGHGFDYHTGRSGGISDGAFSEGIGDIISAYLTKSPNMGAGFFTNREQGIRNLDNNRRYPDDQGGVHYEGTIIGGAFWDLRVMLVDRYGETRGSYLAGHYFYRHLLTTDSYRESYNAVLRLDDNDGNPSTRSPNHCLINEAFAKHGLATEENCQDPIAEDKAVKVDPTIALAMIDGKVAVAVQSATEAYLCRDTADACLTGARVDMTLDLDGQKNGRRIFLSSTDYTPKEQETITIVTKNSRGDLIGYRTMKFVGK